MIPDIRKLESRLEKLRPKHIVVIVQNPNGDRRRLTVEEYLAAGSEVDLIAVHGTNVGDVNRVLERFIGFESAID